MVKKASEVEGAMQEAIRIVTQERKSAVLECWLEQIQYTSTFVAYLLSLNDSLFTIYVTIAALGAMVNRQ